MPLEGYQCGHVMRMDGNHALRRALLWVCVENGR